jgi:hypothetical protein
MNMHATLKGLRNRNSIIKAPLDAYLFTHPNSMFSDHVADRIAQQIHTQPRIRSNSFSASSSGGCNRRQVLEYLGAPVQGAFDARQILLFMNGNFVHLMLQALTLEAGIIQSIEVPLSWPRMRCKGTMDGVGNIPPGHPMEEHDEEFIAEFKGINQYTYQATVKGEPSIGYKKQVAKYMLLSGINVASIFYVNKNDQGTHEWVYSAKDLKVYIDQGRKELEEVNEAIDHKKLPTVLPGAKTNINPECQQCPFSGPTGICLNTGDWWSK